MAPNWRASMARAKKTSAATEPTNTPRAALEPGPAQEQAVVTVAEGSPNVASEGGQPVSLATENNSISATAPIAAEQGDDNSLDGAAQAHASGHGDVDPLGAQGADSVVADVQPSTGSNPLDIQIYPLRSYMDEGELRRRGGAAYMAPRLHAEDLVRRGLASLDPLKE